LSGSAQHNLRALAVDPGNPQRLYVGDVLGNIFVSQNAGQKWTARNTGLPTSAIINMLAFESSGKKLYAATANGLLVSTDQAQHWQHVAGAPVANYLALAFVNTAPDTIYAATFNQGIVGSTDGGQHWQTLATGLPKDVTVYGLSFDATMHQLWAATAAGFYRSDNGGALWQAFSTGLPGDVLAYTVQSAAADGGAHGLIYAGTSQGFFRSQDDGVHWSRGQEAFAGAQVYAILIDFRTTNSKTLYIGTSQGVLRSDDAGQTWGIAASGLPKNSTVYALAFGGDTNAQLFAATDGIYQYPGTSGGLSPTHIVPLIMIAIFFYLLLRFTQRTRLKPRPKTTTPNA
jgi:photosystem II stability/assembly factor-like uncharacterized protein